MVLLLPIAALQVVEGRQVDERERMEAEARLRMSAAALAREARAVGEGNIRALETLAGVLEIDANWREDAERSLSTLHTRYGGFDFVYAADASGRSFAADTTIARTAPAVGIDYSDRDYLREALGQRKTAVSDVQVGRVTKRAAVHVGVPVVRSGVVAGVLGGSLDLGAVQAVARQISEDFGEVTVHIVDSKGRLVAASDGTTQTAPFDTPAPFDDSLRPLESRERARDGGEVHVVKVSAGPTLRWTVVAFTSESDIVAEAAEARQRIMAVALVMAVFGLVVAVLLARWIGRPIISLAVAASKVSSGGEAEAPKPRCGEPREVAILLAVFGEMLARISKHTAELQDTVEARTGELGATNRTLEQKLAELQDTQARLGLSDRMASVGTLAAGVAHEINNPMTYVQANLELIAEDLSAFTSSPPTAEELANVQEQVADALAGAHRVTEIVRDLKQFSRAEDAAVEPTDLQPIIEMCTKVAGNEIRHRAQLSIESGTSRQVLANPGKLTQVFLNLIVNAAQAIEPGAADRNFIRVTTRDVPDGVAVDVIDSGQGISPEHLSRIFDPFFTTKAVGQGTGLGLAICERIVSSLAGRLEVASELGRGTTITVVLPAAAVAAKEVERPSIQPPRSATFRVVAVDDEPMVLQAIHRTLARQGDVSSYYDPRTALDRLCAGEVADLVLCDVMMPTMNGLDLYDQLRAARPELAERVVFMTGATFSESLAERLAETGRRVLAKPFSVEALRHAVAHVDTTGVRGSVLPVGSRPYGDGVARHGGP